MNEATLVLKKHWDGQLPIDVKSIARKYTTVEGRYLSDQGLSGMYCASHADSNGGPLILYNTDAALVHQRFTIAHELGHHILRHGDACRDPSKHFNVNNYDPKEVEANKFAAEMLVPEFIINHFVGDLGEYSVEKLAQTFFVSQASIRYRLSNLGWM